MHVYQSLKKILMFVDSSDILRRPQKLEKKSRNKIKNKGGFFQILWPSHTDGYCLLAFGKSPNLF